MSEHNSPRSPISAIKSLYTGATSEPKDKARQDAKSKGGSSSVSDQVLDTYNKVTDKSNLTYQNVNVLMRQAFIRSRILNNAEANPGAEYEKLNNAGQVDVCVIGDGGSNLCDAIVKFIAQDPEKDRASFAICRGHLGADGVITGDTHWTALHLRRTTGPDGKDYIQPYYADSAGGKVPKEVKDCLLVDKEPLNNPQIPHHATENF